MMKGAFSSDQEKRQNQFLSFKISELRPSAIHSNGPNYRQRCQMSDEIEPEIGEGRAFSN